MDLINQFLDLFRDLNGLVATAGYAGITAIIFIETGLLFPFLPGDSLLVTAGIVSAGSDPTVQLNVWLLGTLCSVAAIAGDQIAYGIGRKSGEALYRRPDSRWFKQSHLRAAHDFYEKHGGKTIIMARFMPFARTFAPVVAGAAKMHYPTFVFYNVIGGLAWIWSMLLIGHYVVKVVPGLEAHVEKLAVAIIIISVMPAVIAWWKQKRKAAEVGRRADV
jgi:membrane-associated protein